MMRFALIMLLSAMSYTAGAQTPEAIIALNRPDLNSGKLLMQALQERQTSRAFSDKELPLQELSNLLWAVYGFNREDKRVVPSSMNRQDVEVYVVLRKGIYWYNAKETRMELVAAGDHREAAGGANYGKAPVNLLYISNLSKLGGNTESARITANINTGHSSQNGYLYAASAGLACVVRSMGMDRAKLAEIMKLSPDQLIVVAQTFGYHAE